MKLVLANCGHFFSLLIQTPHNFCLDFLLLYLLLLPHRFSLSKIQQKKNSANVTQRTAVNHFDNTGSNMMYFRGHWRLVNTKFGDWWYIYLWKKYCVAAVDWRRTSERKKWKNKNKNKNLTLPDKCPINHALCSKEAVCILHILHEFMRIPRPEPMNNNIHSNYVLWWW